MVDQLSHSHSALALQPCGTRTETQQLNVFRKYYSVVSLYDKDGNLQGDFKLRDTWECLVIGSWQELFNCLHRCQAMYKETMVIKSSIMQSKQLQGRAIIGKTSLMSRLAVACSLITKLLEKGVLWVVSMRNESLQGVLLRKGRKRCSTNCSH